VKGADATDPDPYEWRTYETIVTNGMEAKEISERLSGYGIKAPHKPHDEM